MRGDHQRDAGDDNEPFDPSCSSHAISVRRVVKKSRDGLKAVPYHPSTVRLKADTTYVRPLRRFRRNQLADRTIRLVHRLIGVRRGGRVRIGDRDAPERLPSDLTGRLTLGPVRIP